MDNWNPVTTRPTKSGSYLVVLCEENKLELPCKKPVMAEYGFFKEHFYSWTIFDAEIFKHVFVNNDVLWWMELPKVPVNPPLNVWIDWHHKPENPFPKLEGDPLIDVMFTDLSTSIDRGTGANPVSYWATPKDNQFNQHDEFMPDHSKIIAYMLVDEKT